MIHQQIHFTTHRSLTLPAIIRDKAAAVDVPTLIHKIITLTQRTRIVFNVHVG